MARFQRWSTTVVGVGLIVLYVSLLSVYDFRGLPTPTAVGVVISFLSAGAYVLTGLRDEFSFAGRTITWHQTMGTGTILLAIGFALVSVPLALSNPLFGVAIVCGSGVLVFAGYQELMDGVHVDLETAPSRAGIVAITVLVALTVAFGLFLFTPFL